MTINGAEDIRNLKNKLEDLKGVVDVKVTPSDSVIRVEFDSNTVGIRNVLESIKVQYYTKLSKQQIHKHTHFSFDRPLYFKI